MSINKIYNLNKTVKAIGLALVIAFFGGSIIALSSCDSNGDSSYNVNRLTAVQRADIEQAGIFHAKTLDAIITDFMRERVRVFHESANQPSGLRSTTSTHVCLEQVALNTTKRLMKEWELVQDEQEAQAFISEFSMLNHGGTRATFEADMIRQLTPFQTEYYHRLMSIIERSDVMNELEPLLSEIVALEVQIEQNAPTMEEAKPLLYAASVVRHAAKYWNENRKMWFTMLFSEIVGITAIEDAAKGITLRTVGASPFTRTRHISCSCFMFFPDTGCPYHFFVLTATEGVTHHRCPADLMFCAEVSSCVFPHQVVVGSDGIGGAGVGINNVPSSLRSWLACAGTAIGGAAVGAVGGGSAAVPLAKYASKIPKLAGAIIAVGATGGAVTGAIQGWRLGCS